MREPQSKRVGEASLGLEDFSALYEQYAARVFTYFQYRCNDSATAQDLTAQVFERVLRCLPDYDAGRAPFAAWLFAIARHVAADWQRRQYLRKFLPWEDFFRQPSADPGPEQLALESEERRQLRQALGLLSSRERDLIGLRFSSGLTNRAIADLTGLSESNVAVILYRALGKLRQRLSGAAAPGDPPLTVNIACSQPAPQAEVDHE